MRAENRLYSDKVYFNAKIASKDIVTKIISYNINGIRAALRKDLITWLKAADPDVLCLQEVKANEDQVDLTVFEELGYDIHWFSAEKKGYKIHPQYNHRQTAKLCWRYQQEIARSLKLLII